MKSIFYAGAAAVAVGGWGSLAYAAEAPAAEVQVARQKHSIQPCQGDDKRCARAWYGEYKAGILAELKHYRGLAGEIRRLHQAQDAAGAKALLDRLVAGGYYKHDEWDFPKDPAVPIAGVSSADVGAIGDCRVAIASLRLYLVDAAKQGGDFDDDWKSYNEFWRKCAKHYKLK